jgi:MFS family permease
MASDWLQGPYVYALYKAYGFTKLEIGQLFVAGFSSSMVFGTFVGALADKLGRKRMALLFCVVYGVSCGTKLWNNFIVLMVGRLLAGIATSLLFSVFEAWLVTEHHGRRYSEDSLSRTFALATFSNGLTAIGAGVAASVVAKVGGYVAPFLLALVVLILAGVLVARGWTENYGDATLNVTEGFQGALEGCPTRCLFVMSSF